jgi:SAM-dependent methyltransferase
MIKQRVIQQFQHPRGLLGRLAGRVMATRSTNVERNRWIAAKLDPAPDARILEIGHGPGLAIAELWPRLTNGHIDAVEVSDLMSRTAARRNRAGVDAGRIRFHVADAQQLPAPLDGYDIIFGVNVSMFWNDPSATTAHLADRLAPGGELVLVYMPPPTSDTSADAMAAKLETLFDGIALTQVHHDTVPFEPPAVAVHGRRPIVAQA